MTLGEIARGIPFHGFTSLSLGYALIDTWLSGPAPVFGVYALSLIGHCMAGSLTYALTVRHPRHALAWVVGVGAVLIICAAGQGIQWVRPVGEALSFRLIQGNVVQQRKFDPAYFDEQSQRYVSLIRAQSADMVVTPETAFPLPLSELTPQAPRDLQAFARGSGSHLFLGMATIDANAQGRNSVVHVAPDHDLLQQYDKVQLMPFGEYGPAGFGWFTDRLHIALKDLTPGAEDQRPFEVRGQAVGTLICHEDLSSTRARRWLSVEPAIALFLNPSNLAWFEGSAAIEQRQQIVRMRALEVGRPVLRVANTGVTALIDHRGAVRGALPSDGPGTLDGAVLGRQGLTPFTRWGDVPIGALCVIAVAACAVQACRRRREA
jgi:apolipoprotein N-acyltransferase